jgi:hypothetical protein
MPTIRMTGATGDDDLRSNCHAVLRVFLKGSANPERRSAPPRRDSLFLLEIARGAMLAISTSWSRSLARIFL